MVAVDTLYYVILTLVLVRGFLELYRTKTGYEAALAFIKYLILVLLMPFLYRLMVILF